MSDEFVFILLCVKNKHLLPFSSKMSLFWLLVVLLFVHGSAAQVIAQFENVTSKSVLLQDLSVSVVDLEPYIPEWTLPQCSCPCDCCRDAACMKIVMEGLRPRDRSVSQYTPINVSRPGNATETEPEIQPVEATQHSRSAFLEMLEDTTITYDLEFHHYAPRRGPWGPNVTPSYEHF